MGRQWNIQDLVDFEYFLYQDEEVSAEELARRDRAYYLRQDEVPAERSDLFHNWLRHRRELEGDSGSGTPGDAFAECFSILRKAFPFAGFVSGAGLAIGLLQYHGTQAVNVSNYFGVLVVLQIVLLLVLFGALLYRRKVSGSGIQSTYPLLARLVFKWSAKMSRSALAKLGGERAAKFQSGLGELRLKNAIYGRVIYQPIFQLVQSFGVLFNVGALGATLLRVLTRDIAFGWQSTVQVASGSVHGLVHFLALPWRWFMGEGSGYPSLEQVEGSRMVLKEGLLHLSTADLVSWWPFLCMCLIAYGLIPRLALWGYAVRSQARNLSQLNFTHAVCERLYRRMTTPVLESSASSPHNVVRQEIRPSEAAPHYDPPFAGNAKGETTLLLVPAELVSELDSDQLIQIVEQSVGRSVSRTRPYTLGRQGLGDLGIRPKESVTIYQEAWQPPIQEYLSFVKRLRQHVAPETALVIMLNGRTKPHESFAPVSETDRKTWTQVTKHLADPYLGIAEVITTS